MTNKNASDPFDTLLREAAHISAPNASTQPRLPIGSTLSSGRFRVLRCLGEGGMGAVFEALDVERNARVALKLLTRSTPNGVYRLKNEFRSLATLSHPNVVQLHELFAERDHWFFTMELVHGVSFDRWARPHGVLDEARLRDSIAQPLRAVQAVHHAGKLHCDLKPSNVLVSDDARLVLLDFGLAISDDRGGVGQTVSEHDVRGTPAFMAPEQAAGGTNSAASDLYALGVMLFEALTGKLPFDGMMWQVFAAKQRHEAPRARELVPETPVDLDTLCAALLSREPADRPGLPALLSQFAERPPDAETEAARVTATFVGREHELALMRAAFQATLSGRPVLVNIAGASGVGKSALCEAFLHELRTQHAATVLAGRCFEQESVPYKAIDPLADALTRYMRALPAHEAAALLPRDAFALLHLFPVMARVEAIARAPARPLPDALALFRHATEAFGELLTRMRDRGPLVLHIDDLHWTDEDSVALLRQLLVQRTPPPLLLIVSHRGDPLAGHPGVAQVVAAVRENVNWEAHAITLGVLPDSTLTELVDTLLASSDPAVTRSIVRESAGNPLWARELCAALRSPARTASSMSFSELLGTRLAALSPSSMRLLRTVALVGRPLEVTCALEAARAGPAELELLRRARLLRLTGSEAPDRERRLEVEHDRIRETLCADMPASSEVEAMRGLVAVMSRRGRDEDADILCRALEHTGDLRAASQQAERAADRAQRALAFDRASALYQRAISIPGHTAAALLTLHEKLADALALAGRGADASSAYLFAASLCTDERSVQLRRRAAEQLLVTGHLKQGAVLLSEICREVRIPLPHNAPHALATLAVTTAKLQLSGLHARHASRVSPKGLLQLEMAHTVVTGFLGYLPVHAGSVAARYLALALEVGDEQHLVWALGYNAGIHSILRPNARWSLKLCAEMESVATRSARPELEAFAAMMRGVNGYFRGTFASSRERLTRALELYRTSHVGGLQRDIAQLFDVFSAFATGDYGYLLRVVPARVDEAYRRSRVWLATMLSGPQGATVDLTADQPAALRRRIAKARAQLPSLDTGGFPELLLVMSELTCSIYEDEPEVGLALLAARREAFGRSMLTRGGGRLLIAFGNGTCALTAHVKNRRTMHARRSPWLAHASDCLHEMRQVRHNNFPGSIPLLEAGIAFNQGAPERAIHALRGAARSFEETGTGMYAAAAQRQLGRLLGGDEGHALVTRGEQFMAAQGVRNMPAMTALHCAGFPRG